MREQGTQKRGRIALHGEGPDGVRTPGRDSPAVSEEKLGGLCGSGGSGGRMRNCRQGVEVGEVKGSDEARPGTGSGMLCVSGGTGAWSRGEGLTGF